ncbi:MAG: hypothetical protein KGI30_00915 [Planctomycetota bacterium]|nr:hypothetical protein [Planctomycetota bacterium]
MYGDEEVQNFWKDIKGELQETSKEEINKKIISISSDIQIFKNKYQYKKIALREFLIIC